MASFEDQYDKEEIINLPGGIALYSTCASLKATWHIAYLRPGLFAHLHRATHAMMVDHWHVPGAEVS